MYSSTRGTGGLSVCRDMVNEQLGSGGSGYFIRWTTVGKSRFYDIALRVPYAIARHRSQRRHHVDILAVWDSG